MNKKVTVDSCVVKGKNKVFLAIDQFVNSPTEETTIGEWVALDSKNARTIAQWLIEEADKADAATALAAQIALSV